MKRKIITNNKEVYSKFNNLNFTNEIFIKDFARNKIRQIVATLNKEGNFLELTKVGDYFRIKKIGQVDFDIYLKM